MPILSTAERLLPIEEIVLYETLFGAELSSTVQTNTSIQVLDSPSGDDIGGVPQPPHQLHPGAYIDGVEKDPPCGLEPFITVAGRDIVQLIWQAEWMEIQTPDTTQRRDAGE